MQLEERFSVWEAINKYTESRGGNMRSIAIPIQHAVSGVERELDALLEPRDQRITALEAERDAVWDELYQTKFALGQEQGENAALRAKLEAHDE